ncbi:MAG: molybdopterin synthase catalytic subunit MoaE [Pseudomonadota bacterium]
MDGSAPQPEISIQTEDFDIAAESRRLTAGKTDIGAVASFTGLVRGSDETTRAMKLEHYPGMTERALSAIAAEASSRWPLQGIRIIHRVGRLLPGEQIVLVLTASRHRAAAFEAAHFIMDYLKTRAPFWKREETPEGARWVDARDSDDHAAARWETDPA